MARRDVHDVKENQERSGRDRLRSAKALAESGLASRSFYQKQLNDSGFGTMELHSQ